MSEHSNDSPLNNVRILYHLRDILVGFRAQYPQLTNEINDLIYVYNDLSQLLTIPDPDLDTINERLALIADINAGLELLIRGIAPQGLNFSFHDSDATDFESTYNYSVQAYNSVITIMNTMNR